MVLSKKSTREDINAAIAVNIISKDAKKEISDELYKEGMFSWDSFFGCVFFSSSLSHVFQRSHTHVSHSFGVCPLSSY